MQKGLVIGFIVLIVILASLVIFIPDIKEQPIPDITQPISPSQAYQVCNPDSCLTEEITVEGKMGSGFHISDEDKTVFIRFREGTTFKDKIEATEDNELLGDGIVKARISGRIHHEQGMCTNSGCVDMIIMTINTEDIEFVERIKCKGDNYRGGRWHPQLEDCFDYSIFELKASEAYEKLAESNLLEEGEYEFTEYYDYNFNENFWRFQLSGGPPGTQFAHVSLENITIV
ncbi:MAG: hypothetical protein WDZ69_01430 [Candidatus Pacearchaeota archaeon]